MLLNGKTPYEILFGKQAYANFWTFGCLCYTNLIRRDKDKFGERSRECVFVGYPFGHKGRRVYDLERKEYFVSRDVLFPEHIFPYPADIGFVFAPSSLQPITVDVVRDFDDEEHSPVVDAGVLMKLS